MRSPVQHRDRVFHLAERILRQLISLLYLPFDLDVPQVNHGIADIDLGAGQQLLHVGIARGLRDR